MKKSSAKSKAVKETPPTSKLPKRRRANLTISPIESLSANSPVFDEKTRPSAFEENRIAESPESAKDPHSAAPKASDAEISKHERRTANAALKIAKLEKIPARGTLKAKDIAALPEISEETLVEFVLHCRSIGADLSKLTWEKAAQIAEDQKTGPKQNRI
jgi:hypothetical protein